MTITVTANQTAYGTSALGVADGYTSASAKFFSLQENVLNGTYYPIYSHMEGNVGNLLGMDGTFESCSGGPFYGSPSISNGTNYVLGGGWITALHYSPTTAYATVMTDGGVTGNKYVRIYNPDNTWKAFMVSYANSFPYKNYPGKWFRISVWVRHSAPGSNYIYLHYDNSTGMQTGAGYSIDINEVGKWKKVEARAQVPASGYTATGSPYLYGHNISGYNDFDNFCIEGPFDTDPGASQGTPGWWGTSLSDSTGALTAPSTLTITESRTIWNISVRGDSALNEYPVDFTVGLYRNSTLVYTHTVTDNSSVNYYIDKLPQAYDIDYMTITVTKINKANRTVKIQEAVPGFYIYRSDTISTTLVDSGLNVSEASRYDTFAVALAESSQIYVQVNTVDTLTPKGIDQSFFTQYEIWRSDTLTPKAIEGAGSVTASLTRTDTLTPKATEGTTAITASMSRADTVALSQGIDAEQFTANLARPDILSLSLTESVDVTNIYTVMDQPQRQVFAKVEITYTDPFTDEGMTYTSNEAGRYTYPEQLSDRVDSSAFKWISLHDNKLDGSYHPMPSEKPYSVGLWGTSLSDASGVLPVPLTVTIDFTSRAVPTLRVVGDAMLNVYPVDFTCKVYNGATLLYTETVTGNTVVDWIKNVSIGSAATRLIITVTKINKANCVAKLVEALTAVKELYVDELQNIQLLEEVGYNNGSVPIGNVSSNEIDISISNYDRRFDLDNTQSQLYGYIKRNRRVKAWLGTNIPSDTIVAEQIEPTDSRVTLGGTGWSTTTLASYKGGQIHYAYGSGNFIELQFTGVGVIFYGLAYYTYGKANVFLDGSFYCVLDFYAPNAIYSKQMLSIYSLYNGTHTLRIEALASGTGINADAFDILTRVDNSIEEWAPLGTYWTTQWDISKQALFAGLTARDRLELLRNTDFTTSVLYTNKTLYQLFEIVLQDAGLTTLDYVLDTQLQSITIPYAWFDKMSHREALTRLASCAIVQVYCGKDGFIYVNLNLDATDKSMVTFSDSTNVTDSKFPLAVTEQVNYVEVTATRWAEGTSTKLYESTEVLSIGANGELSVTYEFSTTPVVTLSQPVIVATTGVSVLNVIQYAWGAVVTYKNTASSVGSITKVTITGTALEEQGSQTYVAKDDSAIQQDGKVKVTVDHDFIQGSVYAQSLADQILATYKSGRYDVTLQNRGQPALRLGDKFTYDGREYSTTRQKITWAGYLEVETEGKKL